MTSTTSPVPAPGGRTGTKGVARADREAQIIEVAGRLFAGRGYSGTSVADIAAGAGISKPLIYNYFGSKEGLFGALVTQAAELVASEIERTAALGHLGLARAEATMDGLYTLLDETPWAWPVLFDSTAPDTPEVQAALHRFTERNTAMVHEGVGQILTLAGDHDPLDLDALITVWNQIVDSLVRWFLLHDEVAPTEMTERTVRLFVAVFGGGGDPEGFRR